MKPTEKKEWQIEETESHFRLISPQNEVVAEYYYGKDELKTQDKRQLDFHEIAEAMNERDTLKADNQRLRDALTELVRAIETPRRSLMDRDGEMIETPYLGQAKAALNPKP